MLALAREAYSGSAPASCWSDFVSGQERWASFFAAASFASSSAVTCATGMIQSVSRTL